MPLKLVPPSQKRRTPYWSVRGSYLGERVDRSTKTDRKKLAQQILRRWKRQIERGEYVRPFERRKDPPEPLAAAPRTFAEAVTAYVKAGGEGRFLGPALEQLGLKHLSSIDQAAIDEAAARAFPAAGAAYKNRNFYTPVSAVLKRAGIDFAIARPIGWRGNRSTAWLEPEEAFRLFRAADRIDVEFGLFLRFLTYTGMRLSEALSVRVGWVNLRRRTIYLPKTKNSDPRPVHLPPVLVAALADAQRPENPLQRKGRRRMVRLLARDPDARLFRFHAGGRLRKILNLAKQRARIVKPRRQGGFHLFCHTYGTWMTRYGELDAFGLVRTKRWKDPKSADRYSHTEPSAEARRANLFPVERRAAPGAALQHVRRSTR
jgi:integrase